MKYFIVMAVILLSGCSALAPKTQQFSVSTQPAHAKINVNGMYVGVGSATTQVKRDSTITVMATAPNCETMYRTVGNHLNGLGVLDGVGTLFFLFPAIGLATAGSSSIDEDHIHMSLPCTDPSSGHAVQHPPSQFQPPEAPKAPEQEDPARG